MTDHRTMSNSQPIGVFDSGVGGLSVWQELTRQYPAESTLYLADQANVPYGLRSLAEVRQFTAGITRFLLAQGAKLIVVACNAASGAALHHLREAFPDVPFVGMEPAIKPAAERTRTGVVGVIATPITFEGNLFQRLAQRYAGQVRLETHGSAGLVQAVEQGALDTPETLALLHTCLDPMLAAGADQIVLGCTHYPFLQPAIAQIVGPSVTIVDPSPAVARQTGRVLAARDALAPTGQQAEHHFYTTGDAVQLATLSRRLVGYRGPVQAMGWEGDQLVALATATL